MDNLIINNTDNNIKLIIDTLNKEGSVIAINTDTVYGLVSNASDIVAINKIYEIKNRKQNKPLGMFIKSIELLDKYVYIDNDIINNLKNNIGKSISYIFRIKDNKYRFLNNNDDTISIRIPNDAYLKKILNNVDFPLAQTSCNFSNEPIYTNVNDINKNMGKHLSLIVNGGIGNNVSSTIIDVTNNYKVLRQGKDIFELYN